MANSMPKDGIKVTVEELLRLRETCLESIRANELHELRNEAKLRAVYTTQTYEEFKDIVDAAHLRPISKRDKTNVQTKTRLWNTTASGESSRDVED